MRRLTWFAIFGAAVLLSALFILWRVAQTPTVPEQRQVQERLEELRLALEARDLNTVMDAVSSEFNAFGYSRDRLRLEIASAFRRGVQPQVRYTPPVINVIGKEATVDTRVEVWWEDLGFTSRHEPTEIRLYLRKEPARKWFFVPTEKWRVVGVEGVSVDGLE
jgi:hypothetical protein